MHKYGIKSSNFQVQHVVGAREHTNSDNFTHSLIDFPLFQARQFLMEIINSDVYFTVFGLFRIDHLWILAVRIVYWLLFVLTCNFLLTICRYWSWACPIFLFYSIWSIDLSHVFITVESILNFSSIHEQIIIIWFTCVKYTRFSLAVVAGLRSPDYSQTTKNQPRFCGSDHCNLSSSMEWTSHFMHGSRDTDTIIMHIILTNKWMIFVIARYKCNHNKKKTTKRTLTENYYSDKQC